jgi:hypothetical protein
VSEPGWYADPSGHGGLRYWDGTAWTGHQAPQPQTQTQPLQYQPTYQPVPQPGTDGFAIASFVLGLLSAVPLGIIFGIVALVRIATSRRGGKGLAVAGIVLSGLWIVGIGALIGVAAHNGTLQALAPGQILQSRLKVGDCLQVPSPLNTIPRSFPSRQCGVLHNGEVYSVGAMPDGAYPGEDAAQQGVSAICQSQLADFVGGDSSKTLLHIVYIYPTSTAWSLGNRRYVCIVVDRQEQVRGSMRGAMQRSDSGSGGEGTST